jgi:hypothetical protein
MAVGAALVVAVGSVGVVGAVEAVEVGKLADVAGAGGVEGAAEVPAAGVGSAALSGELPPQAAVMLTAPASAAVISFFQTLAAIASLLIKSPVRQTRFRIDHALLNVCELRRGSSHRALRVEGGRSRIRRTASRNAGHKRSRGRQARFFCPRSVCHWRRICLEN